MIPIYPIPGAGCCCLDYQTLFASSSVQTELSVRSDRAPPSLVQSRLVPPFPPHCFPLVSFKRRNVFAYISFLFSFSARVFTERERERERERNVTFSPFFSFDVGVSSFPATLSRQSEGRVSVNRSASTRINLSPSKESRVAG